MATRTDVLEAQHARLTGPPPAVGRRISLDVARGIMLVASVGINAWYTTPDVLKHAVWDSVKPVDLIFPVFVTLSGCGLGFAYGRRVPVGPTVRRCVVLLLAGLAFNAHAQWTVTGALSWDTFRVTGVLQLYAFVVLVIALLHLVAKQWWAWLGITLVLGAGYAWALHLYAASCPGSLLTPECNPSGLVDPLVFGADHIYAAGVRGHDPEGIVASFGALVTAAAGATMGHAMSSRSGRSVLRTTVILLGVVACFLAMAHVTGGFVPTMKRLWTPPFALGTAAGVGLVLTALHLTLDQGPPTRAMSVATYPLVALGRNSLLVYFGSHAVMLTLTHTYSPSGETWADYLARSVMASADRMWPFAAAAVLAWTVLASILHWRRIYLRP